jgi:5,6-dimethylbenzimidazole synthase
MIVNSNPSVCHLMEENNATAQTTVLAHAAMGHNHFFRNNQTFREWTDADTILDYAEFVRNYVARCEEEYGQAAVERTLDALADHLEAHVDLDLLHAVALGEQPTSAPAPHFDAKFRDQLDTLIHWRRDVRRFRSDPVDKRLINHLLTLADQAPSVGLSQPWRFVKMETPDQRARIIASFKRCNADALEAYEGDTRALYAKLKLEGLGEAPVQFAVFADERTAKGKGLGRRTMPETVRYSVVCAIHTLWLAARAAGLGVGWVSILEPEDVRLAAGAPEDWIPVAYLCIGWPQENHEVPELQRADWESRETVAAGVGARK